MLFKREERENVAAARLCNGVEGVGRCRSARHGTNIYPYRHMSSTIFAGPKISSSKASNIKELACLPASVGRIRDEKGDRSRSAIRRSDDEELCEGVCRSIGGGMHRGRCLC